MSFMGPFLIAGGGLLSAGAEISSGIAAAKQGKILSEQYQREGVEKVATASHEAAARLRQARLLNSKALAVASASGGGATDPTVINIMGDIEGTGQYNAKSALYEGLTGQQTSNLQADVAKYEGWAARRASYLKAGATLLSSAGSFAKTMGK